MPFWKYPSVASADVEDSSASSPATVRPAAENALWEMLSEKVRGNIGVESYVQHRLSRLSRKQANEA
jgi:hypothetical protein